MRYILKWWCWNKQSSLSFILKCYEFPLGWSMKPYVIKITLLSEYIKHWKLLIDHITSCSLCSVSFSSCVYPQHYERAIDLFWLMKCCIDFIFFLPLLFSVSLPAMPHLLSALFFYSFIPLFKLTGFISAFNTFFIHCLTIVLYLSFLSLFTLCNFFLFCSVIFFSPFPHLLPFAVILLLLLAPSPSLSFSPPLL